MHDAIILDGVRDLAFLSENQASLQAHNQVLSDPAAHKGSQHHGADAANFGPVHLAPLNQATVSFPSARVPKTPTQAGRGVRQTRDGMAASGCVANAGGCARGARGAPEANDSQ